MEYIITFNNTNSAIKGEKQLLDTGLNIAVMPLPPQIKAGCGICLRIKPAELQAAIKVLEQTGLADADLYCKEASGNRFVYTEILDRSGLWNKN